jgi:hypothetical protein
MPERIQRRRTKGWTMPENAVYVGRPGPFGNPFSAQKYGAERAVAAHRAWLRLPDQLDLRRRIRRELRGKDLACWCRVADEAGYPVSCHADVLLEVANA